jgi:hypothetical protein
MPNAGTRCRIIFIALHRLAQGADEFDIIHFHTDHLHFPLFARHWGKTLTTLHGRLDLPDLQPILREFAMMALVSSRDSALINASAWAVLATVRQYLGWGAFAGLRFATGSS